MTYIHDLSVASCKPLGSLRGKKVSDKNGRVGRHMRIKRQRRDTAELLKWPRLDVQQCKVLLTPVGSAVPKAAEYAGARTKPRRRGLAAHQHQGWKLCRQTAASHYRSLFLPNTMRLEGNHCQLHPESLTTEEKTKKSRKRLQFQRQPWSGIIVRHGRLFEVDEVTLNDWQEFTWSQQHTGPQQLQAIGSLQVLSTGSTAS